MLLENMYIWEKQKNQKQKELGGREWEFNHYDSPHQFATFGGHHIFSENKSGTFYEIHKFIAFNYKKNSYKLYQTQNTRPQIL